ncbi:MAG: DUF4163 domain-containing protein [Trueperaceae bacterium]|nr:DUF4163 domain-containing protein [Trueperaceae bacterium]
MLRTRLFSLLVLLCAALASVGTAQVSASQWRAIYTAASEGSTVTLDIEVFDDGYAFARLWRAGSQTTLSGHGRLENDGRVDVLFHARRSGDGESFEAASVLYDTKLLEAGENAQLPYEGYEIEPFGNVLAHLTGLAHIDWDADHNPIEATLALYQDSDARPAIPLQELSLTFERLALFSEASVRQGRIGASASFPYFVRGPFQRVNSFMESLQRGSIDDFVAFSRELLVSEEEFSGAWGMEYDEDVHVTGQAGEFLSLVGFTYSYTGGAHGNSFADAYLLEVDGENLVRWQVAELFASGTDWVATVAPLVLSDLADQEAMWVTDGDVTELSERDLRVATLGPDGLTFHFDPYQMGPYVQGGFEVTIAYADLLGLADPEGPLAAFAYEYAPTVPR